MKSEGREREKESAPGVPGTMLATDGLPQSGSNTLWWQSGSEAGSSEVGKSVKDDSEGGCDG